jgi:hypothetical protein
LHPRSNRPDEAAGTDRPSGLTNGALASATEPVAAAPAGARETRDDGSRDARLLLRLVYVVVPLIAGLDKFFHKLAHWNQYLAPLIGSTLARCGISSRTFFMIAGGIEIALSLLVAVKPRVGGVAVAIWLAVVITNLMLLHAFMDVALRDFGLCVGALALARLSRKTSG